MNQPLLIQLEQVCRRRTRRQWWAASCWAATAIVATGLLLVGVDRLLGIADPVGRMVLSLAFVGASIWIFRWWAVQVRNIATTPLQVAHEVEQRYPLLRGALANAWEFAHQADEDPTAGSESLRRAVVLHATTNLEQVEWESFIPRQSLQRGTMALLCLLLVTCALGWLLPQAMATGLTRLVNPLSAAEWPRDHNLQFVEPPSLLAEGDDLVLQLEDSRGELPKVVTMQYRTRRNGRWREETQEVTITGEPQQILRTNVRESLEFRAVGGDHQTMAWHRLKVVSAPRVERLSLTILPPTYTKLPNIEWTPNATIFSGSRIELHGRVDQPVSQVWLTGEQGKKLAAQIGSDGREFRVESSDWQVEHSEKYHIHFATSSGLNAVDKQVLELEVLADQPPTVRFVEPVDDLTVLPTAEVPLSIEAADELSVEQIELVVRRSDRSEAGEQRMTLWESGEQASAVVANQTRRVDKELDLKPWALPPGSQVELQAQASDGQPMVGQSTRAVRLNIVSEDQLWSALLEQQSGIAETLAQLVREQSELLAIARQWSEFPEWTRPRWTSSTHAALFRQRQITATLGTGQLSIASQVSSVLLSIERNDLLRPAAVDRLQAVQQLFDQLLEAPLSELENSMGELTREAERSPRRERLLPLVKPTVEQQQLVVTELRRAIELLVPGNVLGQLERELADLQRDQQGLQEMCESTIAPVLLEAVQESQQVEEALHEVGGRQRELARRLAELLMRLSQAAKRIAESEPSTAARLAATVNLASELNIQSTIQAAINHLAARRLGKATSAQQTTVEQLELLRDRLAGRDASATAQRFRQLQSAERELQRLRRQTAKLEEQLSKLTPEQRRRELERLRREREQLAEQADQMSRKLEQLKIPNAAKPASEASSELRRSQLDRESTKQALQKLDEAQRQLTTERRRQQVALARLQMAQLDTKLKAFVKQQQAILEEIRRLEQLREQAGQLNEPQRESVQLLADRQIGLGEEVSDQAEPLESLPVFRYLLQQVAANMKQLAERLQQEDLGPQTQSQATLIVTRLAQIMESLEQEQQDLANSKQQSGGGGDQQAGDTPRAQTLQLAVGQLRILKTLQTELRDATLEMEAAFAAGEPPEHSPSELVRKQQALTELAQQLIPEPIDPPATEPFPNLEDELENSLDDFLPQDE